MEELFQNFRCKNCGAPLDEEAAKAVGGTVRCNYCYSVYTLPKKDISPAALSFLRMGEHDLDTCRFGDARAAYEKAAELDGEEPEAFFGMALSAFKVQMLKDEVNNRLQPICHDTSDKSFYDDPNFRKALSLATEEQKREYKKRGREIDEINEEFYALKKSGLTYDCFLCAKVTEEDGRTKTADCNRANDIYYYLKDEGYKPFFSEREMKGRTGSDYEALILYALSVSECMLIVCSDESYLETKWVKNEYTRFMTMIANDEKARDALTFVFCGKPIEKLPNGKKIQGIDGSKPDAYARIAGFVKNHTAAARAAAEAERLQKQQQEQARNREMEELRAQLAELQKMQNQGTRQSAPSPKSTPKSKPAPQPAPAPKPIEISAERAEELFWEGEELYNVERFSQAAEKYRMAAESGHVKAQLNVGNCYYYGRGVRLDYKEATKWYQKAAEHGNVDAQYNLGICYDLGHGVAQNYQEAAKWYSKAAGRRHAKAQYNLGLCYEYGRGVPLDIEEAVQCYRKAAKRGNASADLALKRLGYSK